MIQKIIFGLALWFGLLIISMASTLALLSVSTLIRGIVQVVVAVIGTGVLAWLVLRHEHGGMKSGLVLGVWWLLISVMLDWVTIIILAITQSGSFQTGLILVYSSWVNWVVYGVVLIVPAIVGIRVANQSGAAAQPSLSQPLIPPSPRQPGV